MDRWQQAKLEAQAAAEAAVRAAVYEYVTLNSVDDDRALRIADAIVAELDDAVTVTV